MANQAVKKWSRVKNLKYANPALHGADFAMIARKPVCHYFVTRAKPTIDSIMLAMLMSSSASDTDGDEFAVGTARSIAITTGPVNLIDGRTVMSLSRLRRARRRRSDRMSRRRGRVEREGRRRYFL